eukprot:2232410-Alexandrium_andersonii.AAC.1
MVETCRMLGLTVGNALFKKPDRAKVTYRAPGAPSVSRNPGSSWPSTHYAELNLVLISKKWVSGLTDIRSDTLVNTQSDNFPLLVDFCIRLEA